MSENVPNPIAIAFPPRPPQPLPETIFTDQKRAVRARETDEAIGDPYRAQYAPERTFTDRSVSVHSYFRDVLLIAESEARAKRSLERALVQGGRGGRDEGPTQPPVDGFPDDTVEAARNRLIAAQKRDLSASSAADALRPSAPGWIAERFGRASRQTGTLATVFERQPLERGMVRASGGQMLLDIPRLATGAAVAVQASENAAVQETDPTTSSTSPPVGTIAGQVDMSRQLFDFSRPAWTR
jgi:hypothetical protein